MSVRVPKGNKKLPRSQNLNYDARMYTMILLLTISCLVPKALAREPSDVSIDVTQRPGASKQDAFDQATEEATRRTAENLVGPDKLGPVWAQIKGRLLKNSARYVLFIRGAAASDTPEGPKTTVQLRISPDALETLLREFGLYDGASVRVLPLIAVTEAHGTRYAWWSEAMAGQPNGLAQDYFRRVIQQLNLVTKGKSVYVMDPLNPSLRAGIPASYRTETLRHDDQLLLARYLKADVVLTGRVDVNKTTAGPRLDLAFELWQARSGRTIGEAARADQLTTDAVKVVNPALDQSAKRAFADLTTKLIDAAAGGALNLNTLRLGLAGNLSYRQQTELKKQLGEVREVRALRDRLFEPGRVTYEVDTPLAPAELARVIARAAPKGFVITAGETGAEGLVLNVRPVSPGG